MLTVSNNNLTQFMFMLLRPFLYLLVFYFGANTVFADEIKFNKWKEKLVKDVKNKGYGEDFLQEVLSVISYSDQYIKEDKRQFKPQTFEEYYKNSINFSRILKARKRARQHKKILDQIKSDFLVPKEYIISLWAIETDFGRLKGDFNVINSLANLSFDERRRALFLKEFFAALEVAKKNNIKLADFKGSWAGAIGQCQFLPTTYLNHAFDYNKDSKTDIWHTKEDVFASIANYLQSLGWDDKIPWGYEIKNIEDLEKSVKFRQNYNLQHLVDKFGIAKKKGSIFSQNELMQQAKLIRQDKRLFITFKNFDLIKEWNNSTYFALTVGLLADKIDK